MAKDKKQENIEKIRHSLAHLLAIVATEKYPNVKLGIGPTIENGFYYDFDFGKNKIADTELIVLEKKIKE
ncbi:threonine--tRNA ligase, partial [Candidatus Wolfebacteria bacterium CG10_big_fil_rev_8_21_14_0_10_31_9]